MAPRTTGIRCAAYKAAIKELDIDITDYENGVDDSKRRTTMGIGDLMDLRYLLTRAITRSREIEVTTEEAT